MNSNPLSQYFRHPKLHVQLPSCGKFYPANAIDLIENNEYPVLPLTRQDELAFMTGSSQVNGSSIVSVIQSCVPNIKNVWKMPAIDLDKLLVAIKIASHGTQLKITATCTACKHEDQSTVNLQEVLDQIVSPDYSQPLHIDDLKIYFRPPSYKQLNDNNLINLDDESVLAVLEDDNIDNQVKAEKVAELLEKVKSIATRVLSQNIEYVKTPEVKVDNREHIFEWLANCDQSIYMQIQEFIIKNKEQTEVKPAEITCSSCATQYQQAYNLNIPNNT
jgi:hypothetical protein